MIRLATEWRTASAGSRHAPDNTLGESMKKLLLLLACLAVTGNAVADSKRKIDKAEAAAADAWVKTLPEPGADHGPFPEDYEEIVKNHFTDRLKDPDSAKYSDFRAPKPNFLIVNKFEKAAQYGYVVCVHINAKNSYGGYTGKKLAWTFIRDGAVVESAIEDSTEFRDKLRMIVVQRDSQCAP